MSLHTRTAIGQKRVDEWIESPHNLDHFFFRPNNHPGLVHFISGLI